MLSIAKPSSGRAKGACSGSSGCGKNQKAPYKVDISG